MKSEYMENAALFKAFGDENRLRILELLRTGEKCACSILEELEITQPTLSHHMKLLCDTGIVRSRKEGKWVHYSLDAKGAEAVVERLRKLVISNENV